MHPNFDIIEDDPPYPEKPKRKGKPVNWQEIADYAFVVMSVVSGIVAGVIVCLVVGGWIGQAAGVIVAATLPHLPPAWALLQVCGGAIGFCLGLSLVIHLIMKLMEAVE
jgi:hypothetical protein